MKPPLSGRSDGSPGRAGGDAPLYVSTLRGLALMDRGGARVGRLRDVAIGIQDTDRPLVQGFVVRVRGKDRLARMEDIAEITPAATRLKRPAEQLEAYSESAGIVLAHEHLMDRQIIDLKGLRISRINDVAISVDEPPRLLGIDVSAGGLLRRLLPRRLMPRLGDRIIEWTDLEPIARETPEVPLHFAHERLAKLHAADIGRLVDQLPPAHGAELIAALDDGKAADALEEAQRDHQLGIVEHLASGRATEVLNQMAPDAAADLLAELPRETADALLAGMKPPPAAEIRLLLSYPQSSAGGLMTTDFVIALETDTTQQAIERVRTEIKKPDLIYYVYVVDDPKNRRLVGVVSLRDLLLNAPNAALASYMRRDMLTVEPDVVGQEVARIMGEYNLLALPVVDHAGCILGLVTIDDVIDVLLPASVRRRLPRLFS